MNGREVRVMVVEDEWQVRAEYRKLIRRHKMLELVAEAASQKEALDLFKTVSVDALILDLEMPQGSGILLLEEMRALPFDMPFVAVVTNVISKAVYNAVRDLGADYICAKSSEGFSLDVPLSVIEISAPYKTRGKRKNIFPGNRAFSAEEDERRHRTALELYRMGYSDKMKGTVYLKEAIAFLSDYGIDDISITKELYPHIAEVFSTKAGNVERDIRIAIEKVWSEQSLETLGRLYPYEWNEQTGRPTNAEFIRNMARKMIQL